MKVLVLGPNGSGKSACAEKIAARLSSGALYYIATMIPYGEEGLARVERHRTQRASAGFITVEQPSGVSAVPMPPHATVLLEDVSNLLANVLFTGYRNGCEDSVFRDITAMCGKCHDAVMVSIDGLTTDVASDNETRGYIGALNGLNSRLADFADIVLVMRDGLPIAVKGDVHALD